MRLKNLANQVEIFLFITREQDAQRNLFQRGFCGRHTEVAPSPVPSECAGLRLASAARFPVVRCIGILDSEGV